MALETLDHSPPPFFRQGLPAALRFALLSLMAIGLMVADHRLQVAVPVRASIATLLTPLQWASLLPGRAWDALEQSVRDIQQAQDTVDEYQVRSIAQAQKLQQIEYLQQENRQLRELLALRPTVDRSAQAAQILYDTSDGYVQRLIIDKGHVAGIRSGAVVIDTSGLVGQVTRVHPLVSEVTRLTDREQSTPVMNARTGERFVAFGESASAGERLELRFVPASADMRQGDLLITSGLDGIYPPGLHVGQIVLVDRRVNSSFARVLAAPVSREQGRHLLVLQPMNDPLSQAAQAVQAEQGKSP